jgi:hypothetical protein
MYSVTGNTTSLVLGFPIRTSSDQRSVDSSPRHNAASHVLHRPLMPRHPPCALKHLQHKKPQSRSLSIFFHRNTKLHHNKPTTNVPAPRGRRHDSCQLDARNHYPRIKHHTPPPSGATPDTRHPRRAGTTHPSRFPPKGTKKKRACCLKAQQCAWQTPTPRRRHPDPKARTTITRSKVFEFVRIKTSCTRTRSTTDTGPSSRFA